LIHGYVPLANWFAFLGAWLSSTPILFRGESHLLNYRTPWKRALKRVVLPLLFKQISSFLTIGTLNTEYYKHYGVSGKKLFLTPYAVNNDFFLKRYHELYDKRYRLKEELGIPLELPVILYVSKMITRKRTRDLLSAYAKIREKVSAALVFVGNGVERPSLEAYTQEQSLKNVYFVGFKNQTELPNYFVIADVFVLPSASESWGLVINEAMNFGLPIITTDKVGAAYDLVKNGENGFVYPVGDIDKLTECLLKILYDQKLREEMGKRSQEIIAKWSYKEDVDGVLAALEYVSKR
jgi:glycosyltransferase involved in cell wall biosynthesis